MKFDWPAHTGGPGQHYMYPRVVKFDWPAYSGGPGQHYLCRRAVTFDWSAPRAPLESWRLVGQSTFLSPPRRALNLFSIARL